MLVPLGTYQCHTGTGLSWHSILTKMLYQPENLTNNPLQKLKLQMMVEMTKPTYTNIDQDCYQFVPRTRFIH